MFPVTIRVHWADTDAAGIVWFGHFFRFFEAAEDDTYRALGRPRTDLLRELGIFMPRVETTCRYRSPARAGDALEVGVSVSQVNGRRLEWRFEVRDEGSRRLVAEGSYRVACVDAGTFAPRDFPTEILTLLERLDPPAGDGLHG